MPSFVWSRDPEEAYSNPYEYTAQEQFSAEAARVLEWLGKAVNPRQPHYSRTDVSLAKALWMLRTDVVDSLRESLVLTDERRHRSAARLFRDAVEAMDLAHALACDDKFAAKWLPRWYENSSPSHATVRKWLESNAGDTAADRRRVYYGQMSKFTHRTYRALLKSYSLGRDELLVHDRWGSNDRLVLPHTIAAYYAILGDLIRQFVARLEEAACLTPESVADLWSTCLDSSSAPRGAVPSPLPRNAS